MTYSKLQVQNIVQLAGNDETKCAAANHDNQEFCKQPAESQLTKWRAETLPIPNKVTNIQNEMRYMGWLMSLGVLMTSQLHFLVYDLAMNFLK